MWSFSERGLYCVRTTTSSISELTQFESVKSMIRYLPPNGTAGLARTWERIERRSPSPPARMTAIVRFTGSMLAREPRATVNGTSSDGQRSYVFVPVQPASVALEEQPGIDEVPVQHDRPVQMGAGGMAGVAFVADHLALLHMAASRDPARISRLHVGV